MNTNITSIMTLANVCLIKDTHNLGLSIVLRDPKGLAAVLCALSEVLEFQEDSVKPGRSRGEIAMINTVVKPEVLDNWRAQVRRDSSHIGYLPLAEEDLSSGPHRLDVFLTDRE